MHEYLKNHIHEEIDGAIDYLTKALELKASHPMIAHKFYSMSDAEAAHANCLTKIFNSLERDESMDISEYSNFQKSVITDYIDGMGKIESMKKLFWE